MDQLPLVGIPPIAPPMPTRMGRGKHGTSKTTPTHKAKAKAEPTHKASTPVRFDGETFDASRDGARLNAQLRRVLSVMLDHQWHTLSDIAHRTGDPLPSISARLRDLRKPRFGALVVLRRHLVRGLHEYRVPSRAEGARTCTRGEVSEV